MQNSPTASWAENVVLTDAGYLDRVAFNLIVNFERMINRRIPAGDLCSWLDCVALDGGLRPGDNAVQAVFLHDSAAQSLQYLQPGNFSADLDGKAFRDNLGEFTLHSFPVEEVVSPADFFVQSLEALCAAPSVRRLMVVADMDAYGDRVMRTAAAARDKDITLFAMEPLPGGGFRQEILGYSLMSALGIRSDELP